MKNTECDPDDQVCLGSLRPFQQGQPGGSNGAPGGVGGPGGLLVVRSRSPLPASIVTTVRGGEGGPGGNPGRLAFVSNCAPSFRSSTIGQVGPQGAQGPDGRIDFAPLADQLAGYLYLLGRRGADRHMAHALYFSRDVRDAQSVQQATSYLQIVDRNYCDVEPQVLVVRTPQPPPPPPAPLYSAATEERRRRLCQEVDTRQRWVRQGISFAGFPRDFFMYTRPDILYGFRGRALAVLDSLSTTFWSTVQQEQGSFDAAVLQQQADAMLAEKTHAELVALLRHDLLRQKVAVSMDRMKRNEQSLASMEGEFNRLRSDLGPMLESDCDFLCVLGDLLSAVGALVDIVASLGTSIDSMVSFIETRGGVTFNQVSEAYAGIKTLYPSSRPNDQVATSIATWSALVVAETEKIPGFQDVASSAFDVLDKISPFQDKADIFAASSVELRTSPLKMLAVIWKDNQRAEQSLVSALVAVNDTLSRVENQNIRVKDRVGAIGVLKSMRDLVLQRLELTRESQRLVEENFLASLELKVAEEEVVLAQETSDHARETARLLGCKTGALTGPQCAGILPLPTSRQLRDVRDDVCRIARAANDTLLFFDYFYQRGRDFVDLADRAAAGDQAALASHDFRRNFLIPAERLALERNTIDSLQRDFIDVLRPMPEGVHRDGFCLPGATCTFGTSADPLLSQRIIADLLDDGRVQFEVGTPVPERQRQRVTHFDLRLHAPSPYRLGCDSLTPCPAAKPADLPFRNRYEYAFSHDPAATFKWSDGSLQPFFFSPAYPMAACEWIQARLAPAAQRDCRELTAFNGTGQHESVIANQLASSYDIDRRNYTDDPDIFGTSIRGQWTVDIRQTLADLNTGDGCYQFASNTLLPSTCYPARCLSPCFNDAGSRRTPQQGAPLFCGCYDAAGNLTDTTSQGCSASLPPRLTFVQTAACPADSAGRSQYDRVCFSYLSSGQLQRHGNDQCCTESGLLKPGLTDAQRRSCQARGLGSDMACKTPDLCYEICGPRCKAFKNAFVGLEYRIYWRAR